MDPPPHQSLFRTLIGVGLVACGLLAGVLIMQFAQRTQDEVPAEVRTVDFLKYVPEAAESARSIAGVLQINEQFKQVAQDVKRAVVSIHAASSWYNLPCTILKRRSQEYRDRENLGSGVLISPQGYIVTNYHLVEDACALRVTFLDKSEYEAEIVGVDKSTDLAVVRIALDPGEDVWPVPLGNSNAVQTGEWVLAVGNPLALTSTVTAGIVSALGRRVDVIRDDFNVEDFIQTDAAINPGNSGGALVNLQGELIGINTAIATQSGYNEGYGFAIPASLVNRVARDLIAYGEVKRGYVGVQLERVDASFAKELGMTRVQGVYLDYVRRGGAAYEAGLREGDVVLSIEGLSVNEPNELQGIIAQHRPGDSIVFSVWRRDIIREHVVVLLGEDNPEVAAWINSVSGSRVADDQREEGLQHLSRWGLVLRALRAQDERIFGVSEGVYLHGVRRQSSASRAGVPEHVVLSAVNGRAVTTVAEVQEALREENQATLTVLYEDGESVEFRLTAG